MALFYFMSLGGAFADALGNVIQPIWFGDGPRVVVAPAGSTQLLLGVNDSFFSDNAGAWSVLVNGVTYSVLGTAMPWTHTAGINSAYPFDHDDGTAPTSVPVTAGSRVSVQWVGGLSSANPSTRPYVDANGEVGVVTMGRGSPGAYWGLGNSAALDYNLYCA